MRKTRLYFYVIRTLDALLHHIDSHLPMPKRYWDKAPWVCDEWERLCEGPE
ncbi:hypothetical protein ACFWPU_00925 [Streptomyces sp. NPDC058471]|uniref:hypothetical protein n=1 Tax=Streptomyces sp. NPDC058471 TaxID=3346516 RepID=UPI0036558FFF